MSRIYIASSWRNGCQPALVRELRKRGHQVYDFRHPFGRNDRNVWESVSRSQSLKEAYLQNRLRPGDFKNMLHDEKARERFDEHFTAMSDADTCILLLPCGRSAHSEAGYMAGAGKRVFVMDVSSAVKPELMYLMFDDYFFDYEELYKALEKPVPGICRICGCSQHNPCYHPVHGNCYWVGPSLCSHCASIADGGLGIKDDPRTLHCTEDASDAFRFFDK